MMLVLEYSKLFACSTGLDGYLTSLCVLSLCISVPDLIASWHAATLSKYADNALVALNATVSVNVHLGVGLSWLLMSANYYVLGSGNYINSEKVNGQIFIYMLCYILMIIILYLRRRFVGGELGGNNKLWKWISFSAIVFLWIFFIGINLYILKLR